MIYYVVIKLILIISIEHSTWCRDGVSTLMLVVNWDDVLDVINPLNVESFDISQKIYVYLVTYDFLAQPRFMGM